MIKKNAVFNVFILAAMVAGFSSKIVNAESLRTWTSRSGSEVRAEMVAREDGHLTLRDETGRMFKISLSALSAEDQDFVGSSVTAVDTGKSQYMTVSLSGEMVQVRESGDGEVLFEDKNPCRALEWAMNKSPVTVLQEGLYTVTNMIKVTRSNVSLVVSEKAEIAQDIHVNPEAITEGRGYYRPLIYNEGHNNVKIVNLGTLRPFVRKRGVGIFFDGRSGGECGIDGGLIFSTGDIHGHDQVWVVDAKRVTIPILSSRGYKNAPLAVEGCEDMKIGIVTALQGEEAEENEAIDFNSFSERIHVRKVIGTVPAEADEVVDVNNTLDLVIDEVVVYGDSKEMRLVNVHKYGPDNRRFTQKPFIPDSENITCKEERVVEKHVKSWEQTVTVPAMLNPLPRMSVGVKTMVVFEDDTTETVVDEEFTFDL